jgi:hypothetical protein
VGQRKSRVQRAKVILEGMTQLPEKGDLDHEIGQRAENPHVPDTFQLGAIPDARAFLACRRINNLRVFDKPEYSDSPRLRH